MSPNPWERDVLEKLLKTAFVEQRRSRRWSIFFKLLFFAYLTVLVIASLPPNTFAGGHPKAHTAVVDISGMIGPGAKYSAENVIKGITRAFDDKNTKGVILRINSPGGTPVQSDYIYQAVINEKKQHPNIKVYAVCADLCASGAYYVAASADQVFSNPASLVGSIGVLLDGFGFVGTMDKLGVQRRLITAGTNKGFLDPFSPENPKQTAFAKEMLLSVHQQFINRVKQGRGKRLKETPDMFSGLIWTGSDALKMGLIDGFSSTPDVAEKIIHAKDIVNYSAQDSFIDRVTGSISSSFMGSLFQEITTWRLH